MSHYQSNSGPMSSSEGNLSPISPNERQILGSASIHFSPTSNHFNKTFSMAIQSHPSSSVTAGQRPQYYSTLQPRHQTGGGQLHSPVLLKSPDAGSFDAIKCEWTESRPGAGAAAARTDADVAGADAGMDADMDTDMGGDKGTDLERTLIPKINTYGMSRVAPVLYSNPGIKYPRYSKLETKKPAVASTFDTSSGSDTSSIRLPSIDLMSFTKTQAATAKERHQSIMSSNSSCFSNPPNKRHSYLTTSSLQTSIDRLSITQKEGVITCIPEYGDSGFLSQPSRFDRPLPLPPSNQLSDIMSETSATSTNNSLYQSCGVNKSSLPSPSFYNDSSNASLILQQSPSSQSFQRHVSLQKSIPQFQSAPLPPLPSPQQQLQHQQQLELQSFLQPSHKPQTPSSLTHQLNLKTSNTSFNSKETKKLADKSVANSAQSTSLSSSIANYTSTIKFNSAPEEERKYQCKTCGRKFKTSGHVSRHSRIHTGERKHVCPFPGCGARFARHDNCMQHYKTHSNLNGKTAERMRNLKLKEQLSTKKMKIKALIW